MRSTTLAHWIAALPEPVVLGSAIFGACAIALAVSVAVVWLRNSRRLVPHPYKLADYAKASAFLLMFSFIIAVGAAIGWAALRPLYRISPAVAAIPGGFLVAVAVVVLVARNLRHGG
jgi:hypothetical protein